MMRVVVKALVAACSGSADAGDCRTILVALGSILAEVSEGEWRSINIGAQVRPAVPTDGRSAWREAVILCSCSYLPRKDDT